MKITEIQAQRRGSYFNISIDGKFAFSASDEDILRLSIKEGMELNSDDLEGLIIDCEYSRAYNYSLRLLGIKDYTSSEIKKKLTLKTFSEKTIGKVIEKLTDYNLINDDRYVKKYVNDCVNISKCGINKIKNNLYSKGIDKNIIDTIKTNDEEQYELCMEAAVKKDRILGECKNKREKIFRFLISRGFEYDIALKVTGKITAYDRIEL